jgi:hypothetical protein
MTTTQTLREVTRRTGKRYPQVERLLNECSPSERMAVDRMLRDLVVGVELQTRNAARRQQRMGQRV